MGMASIFSGVLPDTRSRRETARPAANGGFWARVAASIMKAREAQALRETNRYLARQSDRFLADIGYNETDIATLRRNHSM